MSDKIMLVFGEDGVAKKYDDTWDITIHCESEEEQKAVLEKLNNSNQEPQELSKNSPKLDKENGDLQQTCNQLATDCISRQKAIDVLCSVCQGRCIPCESYPCSEVEAINALPSAHSEIEERKEESAQNVPKEDLISRKAAIDVAENAFVRGLLASPDIRKLPSVTPKPQWIPVSERLPEKYGNYLISIHGEDEPDIGTINPNDKRGWSLCDANGFYWARDKELIVTAWMPLTEPYRAERRTDE